MNQQQHIIDQCETAIRSLEGILTSSEFSECIDYVLKHDEWLIGLELAIDWLVEDDRKITAEIFSKFEKAYRLMGRESDSRLADLKTQISKETKN